MVLTVLAAACNNEAKKEAEEARLRDSIDNLKMDENQRFVDSLERADEAAKKAAEAHHDSGSHEGHNHPH